MGCSSNKKRECANKGKSTAPDPKDSTKCICVSGSKKNKPKLDVFVQASEKGGFGAAKLSKKTKKGKTVSLTTSGYAGPGYKGGEFRVGVAIPIRRKK
tara:strand:+ start:134 stop:427 length:294 start_codon:yes stop_codon:yes gene_type:complete